MFRSSVILKNLLLPLCADLLFYFFFLHFCYGQSMASLHNQVILNQIRVCTMVNYFSYFLTKLYAVVQNLGINVLNIHQFANLTVLYEMYLSFYV